MTNTAHDLREVWALIGLHSLETGRVKWARRAFEFSKMDNPPERWPDNEGPNEPNPEEPDRFAAFLGRWMIRYLSLRERFRRHR